MSQADAARRVAWRVLEAFDRQGDGRLEEGLRRHGNELDGRDAALARELVHGALRFGLLYDAVMDRLLTRPDPPPALRRALRLAAHQILGMDRIPPHAVGASTGSLLRWAGSERLVGVANAVVRKLLSQLREGDAPWERLPPNLLPADRGKRFALPPAFVRHLRDAGEDVGDERLASCSLCPPLATRSAPGVTLEPQPGMLRQEGAWTWWSDPAAAISGPVAQGLAVVQDPSQAAAVALAGEVQGQVVLDCCAAPGGKSIALAEAGARVIAADRQLARLRPLQRQLAQRQGLAADAADDGPAAPDTPKAQRSELSHLPRLLVADARQASLAPVFDLVVVDAPCSNSGVWGRRPEARYRYTADNLRSLGELQSSILRSAAELVKPGGALLYATCSLSPEENQHQAQRVPGMRMERQRTHWPSPWQSGGYACLLRRDS